jgi:hypothetical protein
MQSYGEANIGDQAMRIITILPCFVITFLAASLSNAEAAPITFKINNKTGVAINTIVATPKSGGADISLFSIAIAVAAISPITFTSPKGDRVFTLTTILASGKVMSNPDTDLCQTDAIVFQ